jgi:beta-galactosidase
VLTSLDLTSCINDLAKYTKAVDIDGMDESMRGFNTSSDNKANKVGQQLLLNLCKFGSSKP